MEKQNKNEADFVSQIYLVVYGMYFDHKIYWDFVPKGPFCMYHWILHQGSQLELF